MYDIYHGCPSHDLLEALLDHSVLTSWKKPKTIQQTPNGFPVECLLGCPKEVSKWLVNGLKPTYKWGILGL